LRYLLFFLILLGSCSGLPEKPVVLPEEPVARTVTLTLPQKCSDLRREPDPATWDEVTETYPTNYAWEECMGVERKIPDYVNSRLTANTD